MIQLKRFAHTPIGTFGRLSLNDKNKTVFECFTVERPWEGNKPNISCIPEGKYDLVPCRYNRGGYESYEVQDVPGRSLIKIHKANVYTNVQGCIGLGDELGTVNNLWAVLHSGKTFKGFMKMCAAHHGIAKEIIISSFRNAT